MRTDDFAFDLPEELIAQQPAPTREGSRLMVLNRATGVRDHRRFGELTEYLSSGDLLVANRSRVIPARLHTVRETGGAVELLLLRALSPERWIALARPSRKLREGMLLRVNDSRLQAVLGAPEGEGRWQVQFAGEPDVASALHAAGTLALPPYIRNAEAPLDRYQTVYADRDGSIAAPTAGLHFSTELLQRVSDNGIETAFVTLHVGVGTFQPVKADHIEDHRMQPEWGEVDEGVAARVNVAHRSGRRVVAVGTTTTRLLESAHRDGQAQPFQGETDHFMYPGYRFRVVDALVTNFHLPRSTLFMLVSAFAGREVMLEAYRDAISRQYRFFSFGDAMLIL